MFESPYREVCSACKVRIQDNAHGRRDIRRTVKPNVRGERRCIGRGHKPASEQEASEANEWRHTISEISW
ncbi:hypothetical protein RND81_13G166500 [Saponaria officinalis]|uniref:Uncharacterized protein n=1 Tax=Saponaria officinalis TaxID=3572 RepID=A0AAW1GYM7_SAPOF